MEVVTARHIQMADDSSMLEPHWGYVDRVLPCTNDAGSCEYLDAVYHTHDISMLYTFILWAVIGGIILILSTLRLIKPSWKTTQIGDAEIQKSTAVSSWYYRAWRGTAATFRRHLLPESFVSFFGHVTRLQVLILAILLGYLLIFTFVGNVYKTWITPVKKTNLFNTRTGLGGFSDRLGAFAYALTPFTILLSTRESVLSLATGIPYQSFNFLHRWLGRIIFLQAAVHTFGWTLIEARLYQPQPKTYQDLMKETYIIWGCIALSFLCFLYVFSIRRVIQWTGYEFFRKTHYVVACLYLGACWGHWQQLKCWMIASFGLFLIDRGVRIIRTLGIHVGYFDAHGNVGLGFHPAHATLEYFDDPDGGIVRLEFTHKHAPWSIGQHFYLCFPALTPWQSHPLTVASLPSYHHTYLIRCRRGETRNLKTLAQSQPHSTTPIILSGPYGPPLLPPTPTQEPTNILAIAGGTGVSLTLPLILALTAPSSSSSSPPPAIDFIWIIRRTTSLNWLSPELQDLRQRAQSPTHNLRIRIYVTQESDPHPHPHHATAASPDDPPFQIHHLHACPRRRPDIRALVHGFVRERARRAFRTRVVGSGPRGMGLDLRGAVAGCCDGGVVWRGGKAGDVELVWDDRG
ncbi:hypothetical protein MFRU_016g00580 [Monilinia fructicola]|nr:hypothetical protein MFRU_016g00580 [Monilinia fructicola]